MKDKAELEVQVEKEAYAFYKNKIIEILEKKEIELERMYKKLKLLKKNKSEQEYKILKSKYNKESLSNQIAREKLFIINEKLVELK